MLSVIISLLIILATAWAISRITNRRIEECVPVTIMGTVIILYFFYILNILVIGRIVVYAAMGLMIIFSVIKTVQNKKQPNPQNVTLGKGSWLQVGEILSPGIVFFLLLSLVFIVYALNLKPAVWDELRLWAAMPKALHFTESLQVGAGSLLYTTMQSYPPGMALLVYFFTAFSGSFTYGSIYVVYWLFMSSLVLPALKKFSWKQWYVMPVVFFLLIVLPIVLTVNGSTASGDWNFFFASLYIDPILGCLMGYAFYQAVKDPYQDAFTLCGFLLSLFVLPTFKNIGAAYACVAFVASVLIHLLSSGKACKSANDQEEQRPAALGVLKKVLSLVAPVIVIALSYFSWQFIIQTKGSGEFIDMNLSGFTWAKFVNVLKGMATWGHIPFLYFALFFILAGLFTTFVLKDLLKKQALIGALAFLVAFMIFFYGYTSHYGLMLSSIHRYTSSFTFAAMVYLMMRIFSILNPKIETSFKTQSSDNKGYMPAFLWMFAKDDEEGSIRQEQQNHAEEKETPAERSLMQTIFPKRKLNAGRIFFIETLLMIVAVLLLANSKNLQLTNSSWQEAEKLILQAESQMQKDQDDISYTPAHPAKCYLALGGDIRKESQKHETFALAAIGTSLNIQNIWCDKLFNEAEDGVVTSQAEMTDIWAKNLLLGAYEYVLVSDADEEIISAISQISPETSLPKLGESGILKVIPSDTNYRITFVKQ